MNVKWIYASIIVLLALVGTKVKQPIVPNQELLVHFDENAVIAGEVEDAVSIITNQLHTIGAQSIKVFKSANGIIRVTYFSDTEVTSIEQSFSKNAQRSLAYALSNPLQKQSFPLQEQLKSYKVAISKISPANDIAHSNKAIQIHFDPDVTRFYQPLVLGSAFIVNGLTKYSPEQATLKIQKGVVCSIDTFLYKIPEVRAGPHFISA